MFFERRTQSSIKHRRLRYLLLLSLRVALLLLIGPGLRQSVHHRDPAASSGGRKMLVIAVDNSFSMRYGDHLAARQTGSPERRFESQRRASAGRCWRSARTCIC